MWSVNDSFKHCVSFVMVVHLNMLGVFVKCWIICNQDQCLVVVVHGDKGGYGKIQLLDTRLNSSHLTHIAQNSVLTLKEDITICFLLLISHVVR